MMVGDSTPALPEMPREFCGSCGHTKREHYHPSYGGPGACSSCACRKLVKQEPCGICRHEADQHPFGSWCRSERCPPHQYVPASSIKSIEEQQTEAARQEAGRKAWRRRRSNILAVIGAHDARALVAELTDALIGDPMGLSKICEVLRDYGLSPAGSWPDVT